MVNRHLTRGQRGIGPLRWLAVVGVVAASLVSGTVGASAAQGSAIVVDAKSGKVLYSDDADGRRYPASLTKMMTLYLLFEAIQNGRTSLNAPITISARAAGQAPSKLGLRPGQTILVKDAILAIVTKSANDVAVAIAEHVAGSESAFAARMTAKARAIGMTRTTFRNASGLPNPGQMTTARDMAILGRALQDHFPQYYPYFSTRVFVFNGRAIGNHNHLLGRVAGVTGIKTGYTRASGFNLVSAVTRNNRQLVAVVMGGQSVRSRDQRMASLIESYIPRATTGGRTAPLIAGGPKADDAGRPTTIADVAPPPRLRPQADTAPVMTASVAGANSPFAAEAVTDEGDTDDEDADATAALSSADVADQGQPDAAPAPDRAAPKLVAAVAVDDRADPAPEGLVPRGWKIQIGAAPSRSSAQAILEKAKAKAPKLLASAAPYTEPVVKGSVTLYRARFGGFEDKDAARDACNYLAKRDFSCLALSD
jgi:D-alanyl-D-alanine carboxypeptidase